ncbi:MAG: methyltransferase [Hyphomonadaceae bacterium]
MAAHILPRLGDEERRQPLLGAVAGLADGAWRRAFAAQIAPHDHDIIVALGCGDGADLVLLAAGAPRARFICIDPDPAALARAAARADEAGVEAHFARGLARDVAHLTAAWAPTKIVANFVLHAAPLHEQALILRGAHEALRADGALHIADYGVQKSALMRRLFRLVQGLDPHASNALPRLMREAGFRAVDESRAFATLGGAVTLYSARAS